MEINKIRELALANGFSLKEQASGSMDLHSYVYEFANALLKEATPEGFVLVPREQITCFWQDNDEPENFCNSPSDFDSLGDCIDLGDIMQINKHTQANIGTEKLYGTWVADAGNPLERSRSKFFVGTESECEEIVLENERVFEEAQEQSHD